MKPGTRSYSGRQTASPKKTYTHHSLLMLACTTPHCFKAHQEFILSQPCPASSPAARPIARLFPRPCPHPMASPTPFPPGLDGTYTPTSGLDSPSVDDTPSSKRSTALSLKLTSVLSASYADHEIRDTLHLLDARGMRNDEPTRRNLKANAQREVIQCNARIVDDFGGVAAQLARVGAMLSSLNDSCAVMKRHILAAKREVAPTLEEAGIIDEEEGGDGDERAVVAGVYDALPRPR